MTGLPGDVARVRELLGREPRGRYEIVVRDERGDPVVLRNAPLLDDGTPMPTRYWLIGPDEVRRIGRLEADGGVDTAEATIDPEVLAAAHLRYAAERDADIPADHEGPRPSGGVGGTRVGVKCLHAHWAWHLAGGDDPVGRWIESELRARPGSDGTLGQPQGGDSATTGVTIGDTSISVTLGDGIRVEIPWGVVNLTARWLRDDDPPRPEALTNSLGTVADHLDDIAREHPTFLETSSLLVSGPTAATLACVERGTPGVATSTTLTRVAGEEVFRMLATEAEGDRAHNPGLPSDHVDLIVATCCIVLAFMRRLHLDCVELMPATGD